MDEDKLFNKMVNKVFTSSLNVYLPAEANTLTLENIIDILQSDDNEIKTPPLTLGAVIVGLNEFYDPEHVCPSYEPCEICIKNGVYNRTTFTTMKQIMLAFAMKERFNMIWDSAEETWVVAQRTMRNDRNKRG